MVVIAGGAATGDDDGEWDSNSANVDLAVITKSVAVPSQGERKKHSPPSCGLRPECSSHIGTNFETLGSVPRQARAKKQKRSIVAGAAAAQRRSFYNEINKIVVVISPLSIAMTTIVATK